MAVSPSMLRPAAHWVGIGQLHDVDLLSACAYKCAWEVQFRVAQVSLVLHPKHFSVKV